ncbi:hypothetical protein EXN66_Car019169 [Channa argus]|uniref:Uncharacterized protein n=1 Tax=Channa argus TaxID=215402 RepID=A0A6G1QLD9_CHAAH|nr:hypothetical protein EXN66_Car019169 [Channa argus]
MQFQTPCSQEALLAALCFLSPLQEWSKVKCHFLLISYSNSDVILPTVFALRSYGFGCL